MVPKSWAVRPDSNSPSSFEAPIKTKLTALDPAAQQVGRCDLNEGLADDHADHVESAGRGQGGERQPYIVGDGEDDGREAEAGDAKKHPAAGTPLDRVMGQKETDDGRAQARAQRRQPRPSGPTARMSLA